MMFYLVKLIEMERKQESIAGLKHYKTEHS